MMNCKIMEEMDIVLEDDAGRRALSEMSEPSGGEDDFKITISMPFWVPDEAMHIILGRLKQAIVPAIAPIVNEARAKYQP